jgi:hypothetical protein
VDTKKVFQLGCKLVDSDDAGTRQKVITMLGSEAGLAIIKSLTDVMDANQNSGTTLSIFRDRVLPFYRIISHPDILSSLMLETPVDTIYTFLFGPGGRRGLSISRFTATALSNMYPGDSGDGEDSSRAISTCLAVLDRLIEINQSAQVIEGFTPIVETIAACFPENSMVRVPRELKFSEA